jgi:hypothetical protein
MNPNLAMIHEGKKFMWDGRLYDTRDKALQTAQAYRNDKFDVEVVEREGKFLLYTRRVVAQVTVTAQ